jgi:hypothetical protein
MPEARPNRVVEGLVHCLQIPTQLRDDRFPDLRVKMRTASCTRTPPRALVLLRVEHVSAVGGSVAPPPNRPQAAQWRSSIASEPGPLSRPLHDGRIRHALQVLQVLRQIRHALQVLQVLQVLQFLNRRLASNGVDTRSRPRYPRPLCRPVRNRLAHPRRPRRRQRRHPDQHLR